MDRILEVKHLTKKFQVRSNLPLSKSEEVVAVNDVSFYIEPGKTYGLVGESGSGKSTVAKCLLGLYPDFQGEVLYRGRKIDEDYRKKRGSREIQVVFQDPYESLSPMQIVSDILTEPLLSRGRVNKSIIDDMLRESLAQVQLDEQFLSRYPSELSGGQRQRVSIARALITQPDLIILDEPITALDVSLQAKIVQLLKEIQEKSQVAYLFISHDLEMVRYLSHYLGVMYHGQIVEEGDPDQIYYSPQTDYTKKLIAAIPKPNPSQSFLVGKG